MVFLGNKLKLPLKFQVLFCPHTELWWHLISLFLLNSVLGIWKVTSLVVSSSVSSSRTEGEHTPVFLLASAAAVFFISFCLCVVMGKSYLGLELLKER